MARVEPTTVWSRVVSRGQARDDLPGAGGLEEAHVQPQDPVEDRRADIGDDPLADPVEQIGAHQDGPGHGQHHAEEQQQGAVERGLGAGLEPGVHHLADHLAEGEHGPGGDQQGQGGQQHPPQVGPHEAQQPQQGSRLRVVGRWGGSRTGQGAWRSRFSETKSGCPKRTAKTAQSHLH